MDFLKEYVKSIITEKDFPVEFVNCGIADNIHNQWGEKSKAFGMLNNKGYCFGYSESFAIDHLVIIDEMKKIIGDPHFMIAIDRDDDKLSVWIRQAHGNTSAPRSFEEDIIREILIECKDALSTRPIGTRMQVDVDPPIFMDDQLCRSESIAELDKQIKALS